MRGAAAVLLIVAACGDNIVPPEPEGPPELPVLYEGNVWAGNLAVSDGRAYFTTYDHGEEDHHAVWGVPADGGAATLLWHGAPGMIFGNGMAVHDGEVFWSQEDEPTPAVFSAPIGGGERTRHGAFESIFAAYSGLTVDDDWIFAASISEIIQIPRRGGEVEVVYRGNVEWIDREGLVLYFLADEFLQSLHPVTHEISPLMEMPTASQFDLADDVIYFAAGGEVSSVPLGGVFGIGGVTRVAAVPGAGGNGVPGSDFVAAGPDALVTTMDEDGDAVVVKVPLEGGPIETLYPHSLGYFVIEDGVGYGAYCCGDSIGSTRAGEVVRLDL